MIYGELGNLQAQGKYQLALAHATKHDFDLAIQQLQHQITEDSSFTEAYVRLADFYRYADELPSGELFFQRALDDHPQNANLYLGLATVAKHAGDLERALQSATKALENGSPAYQAVQLLVDSAFQLRKTGQLPRTLSRIRRRASQKHLYDLGYAIWRLRIRNLRRARSTISNYLVKSPDYFGYRLAGEISQASSQHASAISRFRRALTLTEPSYAFYDVAILSSLAS
ncbi:tetratricopeptide repeat protein, partial [bacterium]|nr:tetratricopeptide repeat protein [bacterium]